MKTKARVPHSSPCETPFSAQLAKNTKGKKQKKKLFDVGGGVVFDVVVIFVIVFNQRLSQPKKSQ